MIVFVRFSFKTRNPGDTVSPKTETHGAQLQLVRSITVNVRLLCSENLPRSAQPGANTGPLTPGGGSTASVAPGHDAATRTLLNSMWLSSPRLTNSLVLMVRKMGVFASSVCVCGRPYAWLARTWFGLSVRQLLGSALPCQLDQGHEQVQGRRVLPQRSQVLHMPRRPLLQTPVGMCSWHMHVYVFVGF